MKSPPFEYHRAASVDDACELLRREGDNAKIIAGGQSLVPMLAMRLLRPALLLDINEIAALKRVEIGDDAVRTGACARQSVLERDVALASRAPLLRQALAWVGHGQTRNRGTVGGSLAHADPCAELPLAAQVLGARMVLRCAAGSRTVAAAAFFRGAMTTSLRADECLEEIHWPVWKEDRTGSAFVEISVRHGDFALVSSAAQLSLDGNGICVRASVGLGGVGATPLVFPRLAEHLIGTRLEQSLVQDAIAETVAGLEPGSDLFASARYRRHLAGILAARAVRAACERAQGSI